MKKNNLMQNVGAVLGVFMTLFFFGFGLLIFFAPNLFHVEKTLRVIIGSTFIVLGIYRAYMAYLKIVEVFFSGDDD
jgi:cytochrome c biogenesis protein CcdA